MWTTYTFLGSGACFPRQTLVGCSEINSNTFLAEYEITSVRPWWIIHNFYGREYSSDNIKDQSYLVRKIPYNRKFLREKTFANFLVLWLFTKVFSTKFGGVASFAMAKASNPRKFFCENRIFHQFAKVFSLESFPLYSILHSLPAERKELVAILECYLS